MCKSGKQDSINISKQTIKPSSKSVIKKKVHPTSNLSNSEKQPLQSIPVVPSTLKFVQFLCDVFERNL